MAGLFAAPLLDTANDDAFITYRYADNLAAGRGMVFNSGERVLGTTEPGWGLLLAAGKATTGVPVHRLGTALYALSLVGLAMTLLVGVTRHAPRYVPEAFAAGTLLIAVPYFWVARGFAWPAALVFLVAAAVLAASRPLAAGGVAGAAVLLRPEAALGAALLGFLRLLEDRRAPLRLGAGVAVAVASGVAAAWIYFGHPLPHTLAAKQAAAPEAGSAWELVRSYWTAGWPHLKRSFGPAAPFWVTAAVVGIPAAWRAGPAMRLLLAFGVLMAVVHPLLGVPFSQWYGVPVVAAVVVSAVFFAGAALRGAFSLSPFFARAGGVATIALLSGAALWPVVPRVEQLLTQGSLPDFLDTYRRAALWMREHSPRGADLALTEIGIVGYYSDRYVLDLMGLVNPGAVPRVLAGNVRGAFLQRPTEYVLVHDHRPRMVRMASTPWFREAYAPVAELGDPIGDGRLIIYRRGQGGAPPSGGR